VRIASLWLPKYNNAHGKRTLEYTVPKLLNQLPQSMLSIEAFFAWKQQLRNWLYGKYDENDALYMCILAIKYIRVCFSIVLCTNVAYLIVFNVQSLQLVAMAPADKPLA
jgi:hypothetical protein